jgi:hypothetical protein
VAAQELLDYMSSLTAALRAAKLRIALNPGTAMRGDGVCIAAAADVVVAFEASYETWKGPWAGYDPLDGCRAPAPAHPGAGGGFLDALGSFGRSAKRAGGGAVAAAAVIHTVPAPARGARRAALRELLEEVRGRGYSLAFLTDAPPSDAYSCLPGFWRSQVQCLCGLHGARHAQPADGPQGSAAAPAGEAGPGTRLSSGTSSDAGDGGGGPASTAAMAGAAAFGFPGCRPSASPAASPLSRPGGAATGAGSSAGLDVSDVARQLKAVADSGLLQTGPDLHDADATPASGPSASSARGAAARAPAASGAQGGR